MINGDSTLWLDNTIKHDLLITDGSVSVSGKNYSVSGATITITNNTLESQAFVLRQSLCSQSQIQFGSCESANVSFTIHENIPTIKNKILKVYIIPDSDASKMVQIGVFKVVEDKLSADRVKRNIMAYDALYDILDADVAEWYNTILPTTSSSVTLSQFRASFLSHFNITAESTILVNDSMTVKRTIEPESLSGADVIRCICEANGVFGMITNDGKFRFLELSAEIDDGLFPSDTLYPADDLYPEDVNPSTTSISKAYYTSAKFEDYLSEAITQLVIRTDDSDIGTTVGTTGNAYVIQGNFLLYGKTASELSTIGTNILSKISNRYYKPCEVTAVGNPLHEVGDPIRISTKYRGIVTYILERKLTGIQTLKDVYTAQGDEYITQQLNSIGTQFKQLESKTTRLKIDTDGLALYVEEQLDDTVVGSYANVTAGQISLKVSKSNLVDDLDDEIGSGIDIGLNSIAIKTTGVFTVDSSNFRLDQNGTLKIKEVTFDYHDVGYSDMEISNGILTAGNMELSSGGLSVGASNSNHSSVLSTGVNIASGTLNLSSDSQFYWGGATFSIGSYNQLKVNGTNVQMEGSDVSATNINATNWFSVGNESYPSQLTYITSSGSFCLYGQVLSYKEVEDINGNTVHVLGY